ncbi:MAG: phosphoglycerate dehydrogenase [Chloroflexi bacterium]|nr:phosphoglycerate dehydrogenase [Chloroflexota bacterium]
MNEIKYKVAVTARSLCATRGEPWRLLEDAGCELMPSPFDRPLDESELASFWSDADAAILGLDSATERALAAATKLRVIARYGTGVDNVDLASATARKIVVTNTPGASRVAVAELTIGLMLSLARLIPEHDRRVRQGTWTRRVGTELSGKQVGLIGMGRIGKQVAKRLAAFDARVVYYDLVRTSAAEEASLGVSFLDLDELFSTSDFVSLHSSLETSSASIVNARTLALMKSSAFLINTARGELVDEPGLADAIAGGRIAGAALDTRVREPSGADDPLTRFENVILTPHLGAATREASLQVGLIAAKSVLDVFQGRVPLNVVNPEIYPSRT